MEATENKGEKILYLVFALVGVLMLIGGILLCGKWANDSKRMEHVTGRIDEIRRAGDEHNVYVVYKYDGERYGPSLINFYSSTMHEGDEIKLIVDPENPQRVSYANGNMIAALVLLPMSIIFIAVGTIPLICKAIRKGRADKLLTAGMGVWAKVDHVEVVTRYSVNGMHPRKIVASYRDDYTGEEHFCKSDNIWDNRYYNLDQGTDIKVYLDRDDKRRYYVDVSSVDLTSYDYQ